MREKRMKIKPALLFCAALLSILLAGTAGGSAGPWNYLQQLPASDSGVTIASPSALAIDAVKKRYYVVDAELGQLVSFDETGKFLAAFNAGGELRTPISLARTSRGHLWVVNRGSNELLYIDPRQQKVQRFQPKYPDGTMIFPAKVAVDARDRLFLLDKRRGAVLLLDDNLKVVRHLAGAAGFKGFVDFKLKDDGIWALDGQSAAVHHFSISGEADKPVILAGLEFPVSLEVDGSGQLYILDRHAGTVVVFGANGEQRFNFLGKGKRSGQLWYATELIFDWEEKLCVVDEGNGRVDILTR